MSVQANPTLMVNSTETRKYHNKGGIIESTQRVTLPDTEKIYLLYYIANLWQLPLMKCQGHTKKPRSGIFV